MGRRRRDVPGRAGGHPRATTPGSRGARRTSARTRRTCSSRRPIRPTRRATTSTRAARLAVRGPARDDQGRRRRRRRARRPVDPPRRRPERRRRAPRGRTRARPALDDDGRGRPRPRDLLQDRQRRPTSTSSRPPSTATARRARTSSTPTSTATSATSCPGLIPIRAGARTGDRVRDGDVRQRGLDRLRAARGPALAARSRGRPDRQRQQRRGRRPLPATGSGSDWDPGYRAARIAQRLAAVRASSRAEDMRSIQLDTTSASRRSDHAPARARSGRAPRPTTVGSSGRADGGLGPPVRRRLARLRRVHAASSSRSSGRSSTTSSARSPATTSGRRSPGRRSIRVLGRPSEPWWTRHAPGARAGARRTRAVAGAAIDATAAALRAAYGDPANWTWGRLHQVTFRESTLGLVGHPAARVVLQPARRARSPAPTARSTTTTTRSGGPTRTRTSPARPASASTSLFAVSNGPSYRLTIDMGDLDGAQIVITTGQSGNPFDPHYGDLIATWANGETDPAAVLRGQRGRERHADPDADARRRAPTR